jgi:alkylation response protein AidB-like acyl-CoA dehydrogenase
MSGLDPLFREEHDAYRQTVRLFVEKEINPHAEEWETERDYPRDLFQMAGAAGLFGAKFDEKWGGSGPDYAAEAVAIEELSRSQTIGTASDRGAPRPMAPLYKDRLGSVVQEERYKRPAI